MRSQLLEADEISSCADSLGSWLESLPHDPRERETKNNDPCPSPYDIEASRMQTCLRCK